MKKIKIAQIGISKNSHGQNIFESIAKQKDIYDVVGYALPENECEKFPEVMDTFYGYTELTVDEILNNPEIIAVTVETEEIYLTKYAALAAQHFKHIHMEKPGSPSPADFKALIALVKSNQTVFHIGYMYRYNPYIIELKERIENGELGDIISIEAQMNCLHLPVVRQWLSAFPGGIMFFLGCHLVDLILQMQGIPEKVIPFNKYTGTDGTTGKDFGMAVFEYKNGVSFAKTNACETGGFMRRQLVVTGTKKTVEIKPLEILDSGGVFTKKTEYASKDWSDAGKHSRCVIFDRYDSMMRAFSEMVRGEIKNPHTYDYELELYKTIIKACGQ